MSPEAVAAQAQSVAGAPVVEIESLVFAYPHRPPVLEIPRFSINRGERIFLAGPSGSGKSTLLGLIGGVHKASSGQISVLRQQLGALGVAERDRHRANHIGFIFQLFNLLPYLSVLDNVTLACRFSDKRYARAVNQSGSVESEAERLLQHLGITTELTARSVNELSIGQQQRVAAARALIGSPELLIADEPTSALDHDLRERFITLLLEECAASGAAVLFVSHDKSLGGLFDRQLALSDINGAPQTDG